MRGRRLDSHPSCKRLPVCVRAVRLRAGNRLATASADGTSRIYSATTGACQAILSGHEAEISKATFNPQGTKVLTASSDKSAILWDADTGDLLQRLEGHTDEIFSCAFNYDGDAVITGSKDNTCRCVPARVVANVAQQPALLARQAPAPTPARLLPLLSRAASGSVDDLRGRARRPRCVPVTNAFAAIHPCARTALHAHRSIFTSAWTSAFVRLTAISSPHPFAHGAGRTTTGITGTDHHSRPQLARRKPAYRDEGLRDSVDW